MEPDAVEIRVIGCLVEKQRTTPDAYPLSLNALRLACNQATNRDPVVAYDEQTVSDALRRTALRGWTRLTSGAGSRARKYRHLLTEALGVDDGELSLLAVLMLGRLGFTPWQYGLAFALPCLGGLLGSRLARRLVARHGHRRVLLAAGTLRACWSIGLAFVGPGTAGLVLVMAVEFGLITCSAVFTPVLATQRLERTPQDRVTRTLTAWSITSKTVTAAMTALWGVLAMVTGPRAAIAVAGVLLLATPLLLPWRERAREPHPDAPTLDAPQPDLPR